MSENILCISNQKDLYLYSPIVSPNCNLRKSTTTFRQVILLDT